MVAGSIPRPVAHARVRRVVPGSAGLRESRPAALGAALAAAIFALSLVLGAVFGWNDEGFGLRFWLGFRGWFEALQAATIGYLAAGLVISVRSAARDAAALRPLLDEGLPECRAALEGLRRFGTVGLRVADAIGVVVGVTVNALPANWPDGFPGWTHPFFLWTLFRTVLLTVLLARLAWIEMVLAHRFSRLGHFVARPDLLDRRSLGVFGRRGLRGVLLWMGLSALFALMFLAPFGHGAVALALAVTAAVSGPALLGPALGVHHRLEEARDAELARTRERIAARLQGRSAPADPERLDLGELLAWEARVERAGTWPFDASIRVRFALYVALGLGSWLGAALVERALGAALG